MEEELGYRHDTKWWSKPDNVKNTKEFHMPPRRRYSQTPVEEKMIANTLTVALEYTAFKQRRVYVDRGGYYDLVDEVEYTYLANKINSDTAIFACCLSG